jgi:hypothetical protein
MHKICIFFVTINYTAIGRAVHRKHSVNRSDFPKTINDSVTLALQTIIQIANGLP